MISTVTEESLDFVWEALLPQIEKAYKHGAGDCTTPEHVYEDVKAGKLKMWVVHEGLHVIAALLFSIKQYPARKTIFVELMAGKGLNSWVDEMQDLLRKYKDEIGADAIEGCSRKGVPRMLKNWKIKAYLVELV